MTTYVPAEGPYVGRPPCQACGAAFRLHRPALEGLPEGIEVARVTSDGMAKLLELGHQLDCPNAYRADTLELAQAELEAAEASGDQARVFVARGNLQRLQGRRGGAHL